MSNTEYWCCPCPECAHRMKKCIKCQVTITKKIRQGKSKKSKSLLLCCVCETKIRELTKIGQDFDKFLLRKENIKDSNGSKINQSSTISVAVKFSV